MTELIKPARRLHNVKCPEKRWSKRCFVEMGNKRFNGRFNYKVTRFTGISKVVQFTCPVHGVVSMPANKHLISAWGCPECSKEQMELRGASCGLELHDNKSMTEHDAPVIKQYTSLKDVMRKHRQRWGASNPKSDDTE